MLVWPSGGVSEIVVVWYVLELLSVQQCKRCCVQEQLHSQRNAAVVVAVGQGVNQAVSVCAAIPRPLTGRGGRALTVQILAGCGTGSGRAWASHGEKCQIAKGKRLGSHATSV